MRYHGRQKVFELFCEARTAGIFQFDQEVEGFAKEGQTHGGKGPYSLERALPSGPYGVDR